MLLSIGSSVFSVVFFKLSAQEVVMIVRPHSVNKIDLSGRNYKQKMEMGKFYLP